MESFIQVASVLILDQDAKRIYGKIYNEDFKNCEQQILEKVKIFQKSAETEIVTCEQWIGVFKVINDLYFLVVGDIQENEMILQLVLDCLTESLEILATNRSDLDKTLFSKMPWSFLLVIDEIIESGLLMCTDPSLVAERVLMKEGAGFTTVKSSQGIVKTEKGGFAAALAAAKESISRSLRN